MQRLSVEVQKVLEHPVSGPGFSVARWQRVLLTNDSGFAEVLVGAVLVALRGAMLLSMGYVYSDVGRLLSELGLTSTVMGSLLIVTGLAQVIASGTGYYRLRAALAFAGAVECLVVWIAYAGVGHEESVIAMTWAGLALAETALAWRLLLSRVAVIRATEKAEELAIEGSGPGGDQDDTD